MKHLTFVLDNDKAVLTFLKSRFPLFHQSNFFFRDVQFGIQEMLDRKGMKVGYTEAEAIAKEFVGKMEKEKIFTLVDRQTWVVNYPAFRKPAVKAPAKPAGPAPPVPRLVAVPKAGTGGSAVASEVGPVLGSPAAGETSGGAQAIIPAVDAPQGQGTRTTIGEGQ